MARMDKTPVGQHPVTYDQPLPGHYPVLTLQLNVTRYAAEGVGKMVLVAREPQAQVECFRVFSEVGPWSALRDALVGQLDTALRRLQYLQDGTDD